MGHYKSNLRDIEFNLFEVLDRQELLGTGPYPEMDEETARSILDEVNRLATGPVAESFADADRNPPVFDPQTGSVRMPDGFKKSFAAFMDAEWYRLDLPAEIGGIGAPRSLAWSVAELILGRQPGGLDVLRRPQLRPGAVGCRHPGAARVRAGGHRAQVGQHDGADRAGGRF